MVFWIVVGVVLALAMGAALLLDRRRGGGRVKTDGLADHTAAAASVEANRLRQNGWAP